MTRHRRRATSKKPLCDTTKETSVGNSEHQIISNLGTSNPEELRKNYIKLGSYRKEFIHIKLKEWNKFQRLRSEKYKFLNSIRIERIKITDKNNKKRWKRHRDLLYLLEWYQQKNR